MRPVIAAVLCSLVSLPMAPSEAATTASVRIATFNVQVNGTPAEFAAGITALAGRTDIMGLQEVDNTGKEEVLAGLAGWDYYRVKPGRQTPVLWRSDRFRFISGRVVRISRATWIGQECPPMDPLQKPRYVTVVRLVDRTTNARVSVISAHLIQGAVLGGRRAPGRPRLFELYRKGLSRLAEISAREDAWGQAFVAADYNAAWIHDNRWRRRNLPIRTFRRVGMVSMWRTELPPRYPDIPYKGLRDQVYAAQRATSAKVQADIVTSDHRPAIATYVVTPTG